MGLREAIAAAIEDNYQATNGAEVTNCEDIADAILATIRENITLEWVWVTEGATWVSVPGAFGVQYAAWDTHFRPPVGRSVAVSGGEEAAKAAALEHYRDTLMAQITGAGNDT